MLQIESFSETRGLFLESPEKQFVKLGLVYFVNLVFSCVVRGMKSKIPANFWCLETPSFWRCKENLSPEMLPKSFGQRAPNVLIVFVVAKSSLVRRNDDCIGDNSKIFNLCLYMKTVCAKKGKGSCVTTWNNLRTLNLTQNSILKRPLRYSSRRGFLNTKGPWDGIFRWFEVLTSAKVDLLQLRRQCTFASVI